MAPMERRSNRPSSLGSRVAARGALRLCALSRWTLSFGFRQVMLADNVDLVAESPGNVEP